MAVVKVLGGYLEVEGGGVGGGGGTPEHPIYYPPSIWPSPGHPAHPIAPGGRPPGTWGGAGEGFPTPPIHIPIVPIPPTIWPNPPEGQAPIVEHPIVIPPPPGVQGPELEAKVIFTPQTGWMVIIVPTGTSPTPSA